MAAPIAPFTGNFTQQEPIAEDAIAKAVEVLRSGRLHRYNVVAGEESQAAALEREFARWQGASYCLACASGGAAMQIALRAACIEPGDLVLTNAFTLAPVPGAIAAVGAEPVLVEVTEDLVLDLDDLAAKIRASSPKALLVSHMRGHVCDMDRLVQVCDEAGVLLIEDCAHTMGATWRGRKSGSFGLAGCFSTQTYKHLNSGEGGLLVTDDADFMARATISSGSYMLYGRHGARPGPGHYDDARLDMPNTSARMDNLRAAILRPQLECLDEAIQSWNARYAAVADVLAREPLIQLPHRPAKEAFVGSSIQFRLPEIGPNDPQRFLAATAALGVELKWFGAQEPVGFTSAHPSWRYMEPQAMPQSDRVLATLFDMRLPLTFSIEDCTRIGAIIVACVSAAID